MDKGRWGWIQSNLRYKEVFIKEVMFELNLEGYIEIAHGDERIKAF